MKETAIHRAKWIRDDGTKAVMEIVTSTLRTLMLTDAVNVQRILFQQQNPVVVRSSDQSEVSDDLEIHSPEDTVCTPITLRVKCSKQASDDWQLTNHCTIRTPHPTPEPIEEEHPEVWTPSPLAVAPFTLSA
ncbi:hypothetical protein E1301_Tti022160 [Triplophysa tibetana]|uniref:Uncharacterized protein n=1 Tax=Triplophysa tibetana TaxID=1572043 RepID=A0A5A9PGW4_9TELE|nr:hypothetical protein E1301_Tti022160 [Triplophysa tibetana]